VRGSWGKAPIGDGKAEEEGLAVHGRPTTNLLSSRTRLRLRRGVRFTVGGRDAERDGSRSRAANRPGNGPEVGIVSGKFADRNGRRSRAANGPGNGPETRSATDRETLRRARWKIGQQWSVGSGATTGAEHRGVYGAGDPRETAGRTEGSSDPEGQHAAERGVGAAPGQTQQAAPVATSHRRTCRWVISAGQNPLAGDAQRRSVSHQSRPRATSRGAGRPRGAVGCAGGTNL
jgi:hypothetical protein